MTIEHTPFMVGLAKCVDVGLACTRRKVHRSPSCIHKEWPYLNTGVERTFTAWPRQSSPVRGSRGDTQGKDKADDEWAGKSVCDILTEMFTRRTHRPTKSWSEKWGGSLDEFTVDDLKRDDKLGYFARRMMRKAGSISAGQRGAKRG